MVQDLGRHSWVLAELRHRCLCRAHRRAHDHLDSSISTDGEWFEPGWVLARAVYAEVASVPGCIWGSKPCSGCGLAYEARGDRWGGSSPSRTNAARCYHCVERPSSDRRTRAAHEAASALARLRREQGSDALLQQGVGAGDRRNRDRLVLDPCPVPVAPPGSMTMPTNTEPQAISLDVELQSIEQALFGSRGLLDDLHLPDEHARNALPGAWRSSLSSSLSCSSYAPPSGRRSRRGTS